MSSVSIQTPEQYTVIVGTGDGASSVPCTISTERVADGVQITIKCEGQPAEVVTLRDGETLSEDHIRSIITDSTGASFVRVSGNGREIILTDRAGRQHSYTVPAQSLGTSSVVANPSGSDGDFLTRLSIDDTNYNLPITGYIYYYRPDVVTDDIVFNTDLSGDSTNDAYTIPKTGDGLMLPVLPSRHVPQRLYANIDFITQWYGGFNITIDKAVNLVVTLRTMHTFNGKGFTVSREARYDIAKNKKRIVSLTPFSRFSMVQTGEYTAPDGSKIEITEADLNTGATIMQEYELHVESQNGNRITANITDLTWLDPQVRFYQIAHGEGAVTHSPRRQEPNIIDFQTFEGALGRPANEIPGATYRFVYRIGQPHNVSLIRIVGFRGTDERPQSKVVLRTIENVVHMEGDDDTVTIPETTVIEDGDTYTMRLEVYDEASTPQTHLPTAYSDVRILATEPATPNYYFGRAEYVSGDSIDDIASRIAGWTEFTSTDTTMGGSVIRTDTTLLETTNYEADYPDPKDGDGTDEFVFWFACKADQTQPRSFTADGFPAGWGKAIKHTIDMVDWNIYVQVTGQRSSLGDPYVVRVVL